MGETRASICFLSLQSTGQNAGSPDQQHLEMGMAGRGLHQASGQQCGHSVRMQPRASAHQGQVPCCLFSNSQRRPALPCRVAAGGVLGWGTYGSATAGVGGAYAGVSSHLGLGRRWHLRQGGAEQA